MCFKSKADIGCRGSTPFKTLSLIRVHSETALRDFFVKSCKSSIFLAQSAFASVFIFRASFIRSKAILSGIAISQERKRSLIFLASESRSWK